MTEKVHDYNSMRVITIDRTCEKTGLPQIFNLDIKVDSTL